MRTIATSPRRGPSNAARSPLTRLPCPAIAPTNTHIAPGADRSVYAHRRTAPQTAASRDGVPASKAPTPLQSPTTRSTRVCATLCGHPPMHTGVPMQPTRIACVHGIWLASATKASTAHDRPNTSSRTRDTHPPRPMLSPPSHASPRHIPGTRVYRLTTASGLEIRVDGVLSDVGATRSNAAPRVGHPAMFPARPWRSRTELVMHQCLCLAEPRGHTSWWMEPARIPIAATPRRRRQGHRPTKLVDIDPMLLPRHPCANAVSLPFLPCVYILLLSHPLHHNSIPFERKKKQRTFDCMPT